MPQKWILSWILAIIFGHWTNLVRISGVAQLLQPIQPQEPNREWFCGVDDATKALSRLAVGACPKEPLNWCCFNHDNCYSQYRNYIWMLYYCDQLFGSCIRYAYQNDPFCSNWIYATHADIVKIFGDGYKQKFG
ncbi:phospholipase A2-like protein Y52B11A.8 [Ditylenchus destructor]|nr:phospholipase A2-like protein Y52B11A.8 [Ditylenchus destructor]